MMTVRILFINAIDPTKPVQTWYAPLGFGYLASSLKARFGPDAFEFQVINDDVPLTLRQFQPAIVGITAVSQNYERAKEYARYAKEHGAVVMIGGVHISAMPQTLTDDMDVAVIGEGEDAICDLMAVYLREHRLAPEALSAIDGVAFRSNGRVIVTDERRPIADLDSVPPPDRTLFPAQSSEYMFTARGCPYRCTFCASTRFWGGLRSFSPEYVVSEMRGLVEDRGVSRINLYDDIFPSSPKRVRECIRLMHDVGILGKVRFSCSIRANLVTPEMLRLLRIMGVDSIGVGMESAAERPLAYLKGANASVTANSAAIQMIRAAGMSVHASFIIGSPHETMAEARETLAFIRKNRIGSDLYLLTPFPGTPVWDYAESNGLVSADMDWEQLDVESGGRGNAIILSDRMTRRDVISLFAKYRRDKLMVAALGALRRPWRIPTFVYGKIRRANHAAA